MASMFKSSSNTVIHGGTFCADNSVHYHGIRQGADILYRATAPAAFHNSEERFDPPKCHPNTRLAVLSEIMQWIKWEGDLNSFIMWLYGPVGAGKSAIAQTIAEMCEEEMILLASFFFSRNDPSRNSLNPLIATITYQITLNLPCVRDTILGVVERDPLIFSKSLAVQLKSLIVDPLQQLVEAGFFNEPSSRRLVIIDGLDECSDPKVQRNIVEVLGNAQRQHRLPLFFLFACRPEHHISLAFGTGVLPDLTTRIALDTSYLPDKDIQLFLTDKFQEIKSTHRLRAYIPPQWPLPNVIRQLVRKSSGQFIYASTVANYVSCVRHKPQDRLDIVLGIRPPHRDLPFAELDALYIHIFTRVEDIDPVLEILSFTFFSGPYFNVFWSSPEIEEFLSLQSGDVELYLGDLSSVVTVGPQQEINILHASFTDWIMDRKRSKGFWINPRARYTVLARRCLQLLQLKGTRDHSSVDLVWLCYFDAVSFCQNAEITPDLRDELINFSFNNIQDVFNATPSPDSTLFTFIPPFLSGLKKLQFSEADHISQKLQVDFDGMIRKYMDKSHHLPGVALLLGALLKHSKSGYPQTLSSVAIPSLYPPATVRTAEFSGIMVIYFNHRRYIQGSLEFLNYFAELLENPERSKTHFFDPQRYATASKECLQLCLCSHHKFSKGSVKSAHRDKVLRRSKPAVWRRRLGVHSTIRKGRLRLKLQQCRSLKARMDFDRGSSFPGNSPEHEYCRSLSYRWALDLLPSFLEKSTISLELAGILRRGTFTTMAQKFPRRMRLAKDAIAKYLSWVESGVGNP